MGYADGLMEAAEYQDARQALLRRLERARGEREKRRAQVERSARTEALSALWEDLGQIAAHPEILTALPDRQRRELYEALIERVVVHPGGDGARVVVTYRW